MKLLSKHQQIGRSRSGIWLGVEIGHVGYALFLINYQTLDYGEVFRRRLRNQILRSVAVCAAVIHMHMHVTTYPVRLSTLRKIQRFQADGHVCLLTRNHLCAPLLEAILKTLHDLNIGAARWNSELSFAGCMEIM